MFDRLQKIGTLFVQACLVAAMPGCQVVCQSDCTHGCEQFLGTVTTGGPFAVSRTLPIPLEGLTLSDAVDESLRPGLVTAPTVVSAPAPVPASALAPPVAEQPLSTDEAYKTAVNSILFKTGDAKTQAIDAAAVGLSQLGNKTPELQQKLRDRLNQADGDGLFRLSGRPANVEELTATLYKDLQTIVESSPAVGAASAVPPAVSPATTPSPNLTASASGLTSNPSSQIAVQLTRHSGSRIIVPLEMVRNYSPADIWLADGDRVQVMPLAMTEAGQQITALAPAAVSTYDTSEVPGVDLLILTHTSVVDGRQEQYYVPAHNPQYYGSAPFVGGWQNATYVHRGDQLQAGTLELSPIIQKSRENLIAASAAAIEERRNPASAWKQKFHQKIEQDRNAFGNLPVVSQIRRQIEQQTGPVSLSGSVQQTTGLNREDFCRSLTP